MGTIDKAFILAGIVSMGVLIGVSSCGDNGVVEEVKPTKQALEAAIEKEEWKVTYFFDGKNERNDLNGLTFRFLDNGGFIAVDQGTTINGVWSAFDTPDGKVKLNMEFVSKRPFERLNDNWVVVEKTDSKITLEDLSDRTRDKLTLERV
jgi:hypothetical protein